MCGLSNLWHLNRLFAERRKRRLRACCREECGRSGVRGGGVGWRLKATTTTARRRAQSLQPTPSHAWRGEPSVLCAASRTAELRQAKTGPAEMGQGTSSSGLENSVPGGRLSAYCFPYTGNRTVCRFHCANVRFRPWSSGHSDPSTKNVCSRKIII